MHQIQEEIGIPKIKSQKKDDFHAVFTISPLPPGYGMTLGNAIRRVLLSSLPGAAVTAVKFHGVSHEFSTMRGVKDSVLDIILNLKLLAARKTTKEPSMCKLNVSREGVVTARDIQCPSDVEILNPDLYITTLDSKSTKLQIEIRIEKGVGYLPASSRKEDVTDAELILVDAVFTPTRKVRYEVENTRVGQMTNLDKLTIEIQTNGSIAPEDSLLFASDILKSYFGLLNQDGVKVEPEFMTDFTKVMEKEKEESETKPKSDAYTPIEILGLSPRTLNALINGGIGSIEQLVQCTPSKLANFRGFGKKALTEVEAALKTRSLSLLAD